MYPEYDNISFIIYMTWGLLFVLGVYKIKTCSAENGYKVSLNSKIWLRISVAFFVIVATFRLVTPFGVGGADATSYKDFYETFFMKNATVYHGHLDVGYQLIYGVFRYFTDDYHYCFCFQHIVFISAIFLFVREFRMKNTNYAPYVLLVHSYVLGFSSMRSSFGMALIWFSFVLLHREKAKWAFHIFHGIAVLPYFPGQDIHAEARTDLACDSHNGGRYLADVFRTVRTGCGFGRGLRKLCTRLHQPFFLGTGLSYRHRAIIVRRIDDNYEQTFPTTPSLHDREGKANAENAVATVYIRPRPYSRQLLYWQLACP